MLRHCHLASGLFSIASWILKIGDKFTDNLTSIQLSWNKQNYNISWESLSWTNLIDIICLLMRKIVFYSKVNQRLFHKLVNLNHSLQHTSVMKWKFTVNETVGQMMISQTRANLKYLQDLDQFNRAEFIPLCVLCVCIGILKLGKLVLVIL